LATVAVVPVPATLGNILPNGVKKYTASIVDGNDIILRVAEADRLTVQVAAGTGATATLSGTVDEATPTWVTLNTTAASVTDLVKVDMHLMAIKLGSAGGTTVAWIVVEDVR
jgi:hypothetical protein